MEKSFITRVSARIDEFYALPGHVLDTPVTEKGSLFVRVVRALVKRRVVERTRNGYRYTYQWVGEAPTIMLVKIIAKDVRNETNATYRRYHTKKREEKMHEEDKGSLSSFSAQELWDELKSRGYRAVDSSLVKTDRLS